LPLSWTGGNDMTRKRPVRGTQRGPQRHAEGEHGAKTRKFIRSSQITQKLNDNVRPHPRYDPAEIAAHNTAGKDRLFDKREQHDKADVASEKTRFARDVDRHGHDKKDARLRRNRQSRAR
jgi:hypothetical protein